MTTIPNNNTQQTWRIIGLVTLAIRLVQGWIFWGGGSRRFIYAPRKLDPHAPNWMANKLQSAMPGAILGMQHLASFLLQHFILLYLSIILLSLAELISGAALLVGFMTRFAAFVTVILSIIMMLIFGWQGATCIDEWTMAICGIAMGLTLIVSGSSIYSVDAWLMKRFPTLQHRRWFFSLASGAWTRLETKHRGTALLFFLLVVLFGSYDYYRGAILTHYHSGPVSAKTHRIAVNQVTLLPNGTAVFQAYVDAGTPAVPAFIIRIQLEDAHKKLVEVWNGEMLSTLSLIHFKNLYLYNKFEPGFYGLTAPVGSKAIIILPPAKKNLHLSAGHYILKLYTIDGKSWASNFNVTFYSS